MPEESTPPGINPRSVDEIEIQKTKSPTEASNDFIERYVKTVNKITKNKPLLYSQSLMAAAMVSFSASSASSGEINHAVLFGLTAAVNSGFAYIGYKYKK